MSSEKREIALTFGCENASLVGVIHAGATSAHVGVLVVVGGPQYRVGSHRQFVLLARSLAQHGLPVLRFDYRGMGDSDGPTRSFDAVDQDISAAIDTLFAHVPTLKGVIIWGLCDAASAALFYAYKDQRVVGLVLLNPWVRTDAGMARTYMKHYYFRRLTSPEFWKKIASGTWDMRESMRSFAGIVRKLRGGRHATATVTAAFGPVASEPQVALPDRMATGWEKFAGRVLLILSVNNDYVADEFRSVVKSSKRWRSLLKRRGTTRHDIPDANHTFSRSDWRDQVANRTRTWIAENFSQ
jgi:uncharacterized protein